MKRKGGNENDSREGNEDGTAREKRKGNEAKTNDGGSGNHTDCTTNGATKTSSMRIPEQHWKV